MATMESPEALCNATMEALETRLTVESAVLQFFKGLQDTFNSGDPEIRQWFLVRNNYLPFIFCGTYAVCSWKVGPALMRERKPFGLQKVLVVFNFAVVLTYLWALYISFRYLPQITWYEFCIKGEIIQDHPTYKLATTAHRIYLLKYVQFLDTAFFILRKKEKHVSFLHVMHHTVVPILGWVVFRTEQNGLQAIPALFNGVIHVLMYTYYGLSAMGPRFKKYLWWKKYLTQLQIIQFVFIIVFVAVLVPLSGCNMVITSQFMDFIFGPIFLYLFYAFYRSTFQAGQKDIAAVKID